MKAIIERFQFQDAKQRDQITPSIGEVDSRLRRAEERLGLVSANDFLPSLAGLDKRLARLEEKLNFALPGTGTGPGGDYLPNLDQLNARLQRVEQGLGFKSMAAVSGRGGDSQSAIDQGKRAARLAHERSTQIATINRKNAELWATKPGA